jgi:hypothetical protein
MEKNLALNFSPLKQQNFQFQIYRKLKTANEKKESFSFAVSDRALPKNKGDMNEYPRYWVSLTSQKDFEPFTCDSFDNPYLTTEYLFAKLKKRCSEILSEDQCFADESFFAQRMKFVNKSLREGNQLIWVEPYYLKETQKIGFLIDFKFDKARTQQFNKKVQQLSLSLDTEYRWNKSFYADRYSQVKMFAQLYYSEVFKGTDLDFFTNELLPVSYLEKKKYVFGENKEGFSQYKLKDYGVFEKVKEDVIIYFFYRDEESSLVKDFHKQLSNLLQNTYGLNVTYKSFKSNEISPESIQKVISEIKAIPENTKSLVVFLMRQKEQENDNYFRCKYEFTKENIPTQFLAYSTIKNTFSIQNLSLQVFSKLGGKPWRVKPRNESCLIIGLGQAHQIQKENNRRVVTKYFAYSVLLDSSGIYKSLRVVSENSNKSRYLTSLGESLTEILGEYGSQYKKIVIHTPFKVKRDELAKIKSVIENYQNHDVEFVVIRINTKNKYFAYNKELNGLTPYESSLIKISKNEYLVWFEGLQFQDETPQKRYSGPTYVEFLYSNIELNKKDKENYLQDIINLSGANWRGFNAKSLPVSIYYCRIVSNFIKEFRQRNYDRFDFSNLQPWFL